MSEDPIEFDGGINLYAYVENDPINNDDPLGLQRRRKSTSSKSKPRQQNGVYRCTRRAQLEFMGIDINPFDFEHRWILIVTDKYRKEAGLGPANGGVPGQGGMDIPYITETSINDHSGQSRKKGAICQLVPVKDVDAVAKFLTIGKPRGVWAFRLNDCWTFADEAIDAGNHKPTRDQIRQNMMEYYKNCPIPKP